MSEILLFIVGMFVGSFILEPIVINFVYFTNIGLFIDIILTKKNEKKLYNFYLDLIKGDKE